MMTKKILTAVFYFFFLNCNVAYSETIKISSEKLEIFKNLGYSIFTGNVYAEDPELKIWSDKITIFFNNETNELINIIAEKNVQLLRDGLRAFGDFSEYKIDQEEILLSGNVSIIRSDDIVYCDQLVVDLNSSTSIMTSNSQNRVRATIKKIN
tara:strand:- start:814 stop:1272 length:459 start_codon:yes stop_codon:yes gene_type:complete